MLAVQQRRLRAAEAIACYRPLFADLTELLARYDDTQLATLRDFAERSVDVLRAQLTTREVSPR